MSQRETEKEWLRSETSRHAAAIS